MRRSSFTKFAATLVGATALPFALAAAQGNPTGTAQVNAQIGGDHPATGVACSDGPNVGATPSSPGVAVAFCTVTGSVNATGGGTFNPGAFTGSAIVNADPSFGIAADAEYDGTPTPNSHVQALSYGTLYKYVTVSGGDMSLIAYATLHNAYSQTTEITDPGDNTVSVYGQGEVDAYAVSGSGLGFQIGSNSTGEDTNGSDAFDLQTLVDWSGVGSSGIFAYFLDGQAEVDVDGIAEKDPHGFAIMELDNARIELDDADGNDITADYTITVSDKAPTTAPEPATFALFGTGLAGLGGFVRRRRRSA